MTSQIKQRIDQIQHGEVPEGYKKTKVGIAPSDWKETRFKRMFSRLSRKNEEQNDNVLTISAQYGLISQRDFFNKDIASEDKSNYFLLYNGEFAYNKSYSNGYPFGALKRLEMYDKGIVSPLYICFSANEDNECPDFYVHYFEAGMMNSEIQAFAQEGARNHGLLNISANDFFNSYLLMPPLPEQKKIAEILSAQDKLIALKEKLIEEKKRQKKYLMQQLLTGKKRLPGFSGEWKRFLFSESFTFMTTNTLSRDCMTLEHTRVKNIHYGDILTKYAEVLDCEKVQLPYIKNAMIPQTTEFLQNGDIVIADTAEDLAVGKAIELQNVNEMKILSGLHTLFCRPVKDIFCPGWLGYYLNSDAYRTQLIPLICGVKVSSISKKSILNTIISTPTIEEQKAIVTIFSNANRELDLLNRDLDQEKQKKKALMQLLLSGVVRVNV